MPTYLDKNVRSELDTLVFANKSHDDLDALDWEQRSLDDIGRIAPARAFSTPDAPVYEAPGQIQHPGPRRPAQPERAPDWRPLNAQIAEQARQMNQQATGGQAAAGADPTTMSDRSPATAAPSAASGVPQATPNGGMSDEAWARQEALRLGIDPQKAVDVGNTEGGFTQPGIQNRQGAPAYGPYQHYIGGPSNPGLGDEALAAGIDPRDPANSKRLITHALEHATRNGWGAFQGAAANGIGNWDGIGGRPASSPTAAAAPTAAGSPLPPAAESSRSAAGDWEVDQAALDDPDKWSLCGPVAAVMAATKRGGQWTVAQAKKIAVESGLWNVNQGMGGLQTEVSLLQKLGVAAQTGAADLQHLTSDALAGNTPIISTVKHYFILKGYDPETGRFDTTTSGSVLKGGSRWLTLDQIEKLGGGIQGAAYIDNPSSPISSAVAGSSDAYKLSDTQTADDTGGPSAGEQKHDRLVAASGQPQPMPDGSAPPTWQLPDQQQPAIDNQRHIVPYDPVTQQDGDPGTMGIRYRQPLQATSGPDNSTGPDQQASPDIASTNIGSSYNDPTADGTIGQPLPSYTASGAADYSAQAPAGAPEIATPSSSNGAAPTSPTNDPGGAQPALFTPLSGLQAVYDAGGNFLHWIQAGAEAAKRAGTGLYEAAQDPQNAIDTAGAAGQAAVSAGMEAATAPADLTTALPSTRGLKIVQDAINAGGTEVGRRVGRAMGLTDEELFSVFGIPVSGEDIAGQVGAAVLDPTNYIGAGEARTAAHGAEETARGIGSRIRGALEGGAERVAAPATGGYAGHDTPFVVYGRRGQRVATVTDENYAAQLAREHGGRYEFDQTAPPAAEPIRSTNMSVEEAQQRGYTILGPDGQPADLSALDEEVRRARSPSYDPSLPTPYREPSSPRADQALTSDYGPRIETISDAQRGAHSIENVQSARGEGAYSNSPVPPNFDQQVLARDDVPRDPRNINLNARPGASASAGLIGDVANSLGGGVGGAGAGAALPADTSEERRRNALIGAGVGMVAGPAIGRILPREGGALATFGASPNYRPPTPAQIKAAEVQGARRGEMLNREVKPPGSSVPLGARLSTALTDPLAATRYAENLLTDTAGVPRLPDNSPLRASTLLRENPTGFIKDRIETELAAPVIEAAQKGLQTELPRYVEDTHQRDILDKFYGRGHQEAIDAGEQAAAEAVDRVDKVVKQRLEHAERQAKAAVDDVESVAKQRVADAEQGAKDHLAKADLIVRERVNAAEKQATALERRGFQSQADTVRRNAETNASQVMTRAQERADAIRERAQASAQPDALARAQERATEIRRQAQDNASQTMTRAQEQADKLKATPEQADAAGTLAMRQRQGSNPEHTYEATNARLLEQEQRLTASGTFGDLQSLAQQIWDASQKTLDNSVAAGRVEPQVAADLKAMYPHYVPTVPISKLDPGGRSFGASSGGTTVGASKTNPIHALEDVGSSSERLNPIVAVRNQIVTQERQNHQNQVFQAFVQLMDTAGVPTPGTMGKKPNLWEGERQISGRINGQPETRMVPASVANGIESMTQAGMGPDAAVNVYKRVVGWFAGQLTAARASYIPLNLARDAGDTFFNTMVKNGGPARLPRVMGTWLDEASRAVADVAAAQATPRGIVGAAGGFAYGATQVDDQNAPISTRLLHGAEAAIPGAFLLGANKNVNVSSRAANDFLLRGGASGGISSGWRTGQRWYRDVLRDGGAPIRSPQDMALFMRDWAGDVWNLRGVKAANERLDLVGRTTAMRVAEARGAGPTEAMIAGRDSSYDPDKAGTILRAVNGMIPFTNATVQGGAQFARALRDHPGTTLATVAATLAPVMLGVEAWNRSDPQRAQIYDNVPQYLKDSGIIWVPPVEWGQGSDTRGNLPRYLWIPTEITTPFVVGMRGAMQHLDKVVTGLQPSAGRSDVNPDAPEWQKWLGVLNEAAQIFNPTHGDTAAAVASGAVPPVIKQTMELGLNKDLYRGNAIMSDPADERASALSQGLTQGAHWLGQKTGSTFLQDVRPSGVEHILRADPAHYDIASGISDQVKPSPYKAAEQGRIANEPFVGGIASRFVRDSGGANLERAVGSANTPDLQAALQDARMRPSEVDVTVPATVGTLPLNRDEQLEAQNRMNEYLPEELAKAQSNPKWGDPTQAQVLLKAAVSRARTRATTEIIRTIPKDEQNDRTRQQTDAKLAVGAR